jgi:predicted phage replisome organizer
MLESIDHNGELRFSEEIPYSNEMLASITHISPDIVDSAMKVLSDLRLIRIDDEGTIIIDKVSSMVGFETECAKKQREYREQKRQNKDNEDTMSIHCPDNVNSLSDKSKSKRKSKSKNIYTASAKENQFTKGVKEQTYDMDELEQKLIKN